MTASLSPLFTWRTAIAKSDLPPTVRLVAFALSLYMNERGGSAWPSLSTLADDSGLSTRSVMRGIRALEKDGYLLCERRQGTSTLYTATVPTQLTLGVSDSLTSVTMSPPPASHPTPDTESPHPGQAVTLSSQEHVITTPEGQRPSPLASELNGKGPKRFYLADVVNLNLVTMLIDRHPTWRRKLTPGLLTALVLGSEDRHIPAYGAKAVNQAIEDLYEQAAGVSDPAAYLRERSEAYK